MGDTFLSLFLVTMARAAKERVGAKLRHLSIHDIAEEMGLPKRTLQRRLAESGTSFTDERERLIMRKAEYMLAIGRSQIEVSKNLGFTSSRGLRRMFLDRAGVTPKEWVRRHAEKLILTVTKHQ